MTLTKLLFDPEMTLTCPDMALTWPLHDPHSSQIVEKPQIQDILEIPEFPYDDDDNKNNNNDDNTNRRLRNDKK